MAPLRDCKASSCILPKAHGMADPESIRLSASPCLSAKLGLPWNGDIRRKRHAKSSMGAPLKEPEASGRDQRSCWTAAKGRHQAAGACAARPGLLQ